MISLRPALPIALTITFALALAACGGSDSGASVTSNPPPAPGGQVTYSGPPPATSDVAAFRQHLWDNLVSNNRCGDCHGSDGQTPRFVHQGDINLAYAAANNEVNLEDPAASRLVTRVAEGHHCWLDSNQACADIVTTWISNWAGESIGGDAQRVEFVAPMIREPGESRAFPDDPSLFAGHVWPILQDHCAECHRPGVAGTPVSPYFASSNVDTAYAAARNMINLDIPESSRLVRRLLDDSHNCWNDCDSDGEVLRAAIASMAAGVPLASPPDELVLSKALRMDDGVPASGGGRHDNNLIARYEFRTGDGNLAYDTSGVEPALDLTLNSSVNWVGGWGIEINDGGKAQGSVSASGKLHQLITASGEFSIEAWVVPATPAQDNANIVSYSGGTAARNVTLSQMQSRYGFALRHDNTGANGMPILDTEDEALQASLQHVVLTYDPVNGRSIHVNGQDTGVGDMVSPALLSGWSDIHALILGNEASNDRPWQGVIRFVGIHNRALSPEQIADNFSAGVGERFYLLFSIAELINSPESYIAFEVSRFDNHSYLFADPFFINLNGEPPPATDLAGMRIGINGREVSVGQVWTNLDTQIGGASYEDTGQPLSRLGTVIGLDRGEAQDEFFLSFARLGGHEHVYTEPVPVPSAPSAGPARPVIGVRTFDEINATMSALTRVPPTHGDIPETFNLIRQQLPVSDGVDAFVTAHQIGIAQLAIEYCNALVEAEAAGDTQVEPLFSVDYNQNANNISDADWHDQVIDPLLARILATGLDSQPNPATVRNEIDTLLLSTDNIKPINAPDGIPDGLARCGGNCPADQTAVAVKGACAAALASAIMLLK